MMKSSILISTYADEETALREARRLVNSKLAACANILKVRSVYAWKGKIVEEPEFLVLYKTLTTRVTGLRKSLTKGHPYEVPEAVELTVASVNKPYSAWLAQSVT